MECSLKDKIFYFSKHPQNNKGENTLHNMPSTYTKNSKYVFAAIITFFSMKDM
jgi:hypothetical protein